MQTNLKRPDWLAGAKKAALAAGKACLEIYNDPASDWEIRDKQIDDPVTKADLLAHTIISEHLQQLTPTIPILSEESVHQSFAERQTWETFWIVDPIDGTKDFINRSGDFSVLIALIQKGRPVLSVLYAPVYEELAWATLAGGAFYQEKSGAITQLKTIPLSGNKAESRRMLVSRSHPESVADWQDFGYLKTKNIPVGSAIKFLRLSQNRADIYLRVAPIYEWDLAAGLLILEEAGGSVRHLTTGEPILFNGETLKTPPFIAKR